MGPMRKRIVSGGGGVKVHVAQTGNPGGKPILGTHGMSPSRLSRNKQIGSELAREEAATLLRRGQPGDVDFAHRLTERGHHVRAMQLRGHDRRPGRLWYGVRDYVEDVRRAAADFADPP